MFCHYLASTDGETVVSGAPGLSFVLVLYVNNMYTWHGKLGLSIGAL